MADVDLERLRGVNQALAQQGVAFQGNMPLHLRVSLHEHCNLRCRICYLTNYSKTALETLTKDLMSLETFERIAAQALPFCYEMTFGIAGEPTMHPHFGEFLRIAASYDVLVEVWTNGTRLGRKSVAQAIARYADWVSISTDGATDASFAAQRDGAQLAVILESVEGIRRLAEHEDRRRPLRFSMHNTLMRKTIEELPEIVQMAGAHGFARVTASHLGLYAGQLAEESLFGSMEQSDRSLAAATERAVEYGLITRFPPTFAASSWAKPREDFSCHDTTRSVIVLCNGDVIPCCHACSRFQLVVGNVHESSLPEIWFGPRYTQLRASYVAGDLSPACRDCANNNPSMTMDSSWSLDTYSPRCPEYAQQHDFLLPLARKMNHRAEELSAADAECAEALTAARSLLQEIAAREVDVPETYRIRAHFEHEIAARGVFASGEALPDPPPLRDARGRGDVALQAQAAIRWLALSEARLDAVCNQTHQLRELNPRMAQHGENLKAVARAEIDVRSDALRVCDAEVQREIGAVRALLDAAQSREARAPRRLRLCCDFAREVAEHQLFGNFAPPDLAPPPDLDSRAAIAGASQWFSATAERLDTAREQLLRLRELGPRIEAHHARLRALESRRARPLVWIRSFLDR